MNGGKTEGKDSAGGEIGRAQKEETIVDGNKNDGEDYFGAMLLESPNVRAGEQPPVVYTRCKMRRECPPPPLPYAKIVGRKTTARLRMVKRASDVARPLGLRSGNGVASRRGAAAAYAVYGAAPLVHQQRDSHAYCSQSRRLASRGAEDSREGCCICIHA